MLVVALVKVIVEMNSENEDICLNRASGKLSVSKAAATGADV